MKQSSSTSLRWLAKQPPSVSLTQVESWVQLGRKRPKNHLFIWLSRVKPWRLN